MRGMLLTCISVGFLLAESWPARSDNIPTLNVMPLCRGIISQGDSPLQAGDRSVTLDECLKAEQVDRDTIQKEWSTFSASDKTHCTAEATMGGEVELYRSPNLPRNGARRKANETAISNRYKRQGKANELNRRGASTKQGDGRRTRRNISTRISTQTASGSPAPTATL